MVDSCLLHYLCLTGTTLFRSYNRFSLRLTNRVSQALDLNIPDLTTLGIASL